MKSASLQAVSTRYILFSSFYKVKFSEREKNGFFNENQE